MQQLVEQVSSVARQAGEAIMAIYRTDFTQYSKADSSPLTEADLAAHHIICDGLAAISSLPVLSEESPAEQMKWDVRRNWNEFWLVDPLDGTKEFINKNDEFTVNIALIRDGKAVLGVVYCPPLDRLYFAAEGVGAFRQDGQGAEPTEIRVSPEPVAGETWNVVGSRRHGAEALEKFARSLGEVETVSMGSSLKLCLVAEGQAHLYPRLAPTCEWDTGAAQAIVEIAGGAVLTPDLLPLQYGQKEDLLNPYFIVCAQLNPAWGSVFTGLCTTSETEGA
ncbi:MAG: 3'(2'),5'-bisphosphate nucleotidase CysQ [Oceanospirillaceae bacterium]|nr:3'(2'),5'-bisphosphate nucleotidase CysQ [Oceanospirillaceae bacterium]MCP5334547.1 3'(2'),5'-bisphosphate nucleotidase CysQ [Oceanospirillaceae bacterium]